MVDEPRILIVDEHDQPIGAATMSDAHHQGLWHRIVYVMAEDPSGKKVLLQKRSAHVDTYPNCWDVSAAGHVDEGEDYETAALREFKEELGVSGLKLLEIGHFKNQDVFEDRILNRFNKVYKATMPTNTPLQLQTVELGRTTWINIERLKQLLVSKPDDFAFGLIDVFKHFY